jgi:hypothetical protein
MTDTTKLAELTTRAADLADKCEAAGALVAAAVLRGIATEVEDLIIRTGSAPVLGWIGGEPEPAPGSVSVCNLTPSLSCCLTRSIGALRRGHLLCTSLAALLAQLGGSALRLSTAYDAPQNSRLDALRLAAPLRETRGCGLNLVDAPEPLEGAALLLGLGNHEGSPVR